MLHCRYWPLIISKILLHLLSVQIHDRLMNWIPQLSIESINSGNTSHLFLVPSIDKIKLVKLKQYENQYRLILNELKSRWILTTLRCVSKKSYSRSNVNEEMESLIFLRIINFSYELLGFNVIGIWAAATWQENPYHHQNYK